MSILGPPDFRNLPYGCGYCMSLLGRLYHCPDDACAYVPWLRKPRAPVANPAMPMRQECPLYGSPEVGTPERFSGAQQPGTRTQNNASVRKLSMPECHVSSPPMSSASLIANQEGKWHQCNQPFLCALLVFGDDLEL